MLAKGEEYTDRGRHHYGERHRERVAHHRAEKAGKMGMTLVAAPQAEYDTLMNQALEVRSLIGMHVGGGFFKLIDSAREASGRPSVAASRLAPGRTSVSSGARTWARPTCYRPRQDHCRKRPRSGPAPRGRGHSLVQVRGPGWPPREPSERLRPGWRTQTNWQRRQAPTVPMRRHSPGRVGPPPPPGCHRARQKCSSSRGDRFPTTGRRCRRRGSTAR
jgi:hypothetical protein